MITRRRLSVVVGYDGSEGSHEAITHGVALARGGRVVIVHALGPERFDEGRSVLDAILLEGNAELADARYDLRLCDGDPVDALLAVAAELDADAIVVGTHGRGRLSGALLGSVAHRLLQRADRPVTVIPPRCVERLSARRAVPATSGRS